MENMNNMNNMNNIDNSNDWKDAEQFGGYQEPMNGEIQTIFNSLGNSYEEEIQGNPIGWLEEMCTAKRWPTPTYDTEMVAGLPHERQFTIACTILKSREVGSGKSKKLAKRLAAHKMWTRLQDNPLEHLQMSQAADELGNGDVWVNFY